MVRPHGYQQQVIDFLIDRLFVHEERGAGVFLDPGLGKTLITLSVIDRLKALGEVKRTLVVAPLRVCYSVWPAEIEKWSFDLSWQIAHGTLEERVEILKSDAEVVLINREAVALVPQDLLTKFELLVVDESTSFKSWSAVRTKALRKVVPRIPRRIILTGTPSPNSTADLFAQVWLLDEGAALGRTLTEFRQRYQYQGGYKMHEWLMRPGADLQIAGRVSPLCYRLRAEDHLDLPERVDNVVWLTLPADVQAQYKQLEEELFVQLPEGGEVLALSAGAQYGLCRQFCQGGVYDSVSHRNSALRRSLYCHGTKVEALVDLIAELQGKPVLVAYQYSADAARICERLGHLPVICGATSAEAGAKLIDQWNRNELPILLIQPQAISHGVNLQHGGHDLIWFGLTDQLEIYLQTNARLHRQGVTDCVRIHHLLCERTVETAVWRRLQRKDASQAALLEELRRYRDESE